MKRKTYITKTLTKIQIKTDKNKFKYLNDTKTNIYDSIRCGLSERGCFHSGKHLIGQKCGYA